MDLVCGIDEAGRGPVIGPMVIAGVLVTRAEEALLKKLGVRDSKLITPPRRNKLARSIKNIVKKFKILIISPATIDTEVSSESSNLNLLEARKSAEIITGLKPSIVYLDCPSNNIKGYTQQVKKYLKKKVTIISEHKADKKYIAVSAASIIAKVTRDYEIAKIQKSIKVPIGSGYPSDPITQAFLTRYYKKYPLYIRRSWSSYKVLVTKQHQKTIGEF